MPFSEDFEDLDLENVEALRHWLSGPEEIRGRYFRVPVWVEAGSGLSRIQGIFVGLNEEVLGRADRRLVWSDTRMGINLSTALGMLGGDPATARRGWLVGVWDLPLLGNTPVFFVRKVEVKG